jgi:hypothetical protein
MSFQLDDAYALPGFTEEFHGGLSDVLRRDHRDLVIERLQEAMHDAGFVSTDIFDRQVRAFGEEIQELLATLHIGIVGNGGTGSAVAEQLIRLGVGRLSLFEGQTLDASNVTRVYGSRLSDVDRPKVEIIELLAKEIGFGTDVTLFPRHITKSETAKALRDCDVIFGCTDDEWGRSILSKLAIDYYIPVFDMGVKIDSTEGWIVSVQGRVTTLFPGAACLFCRGRINAEGIRAQVIDSCNPEQAEELRRQQYAPELQGNAPAVIAFTSAVASTAVSELLHRLTGFKGPDRVSSEVIHFFRPEQNAHQQPFASSRLLLRRQGTLGTG